MRRPSQRAATRGPRKPLPGHGHRLHPHLAAGLRLGGNATQPRTLVPAPSVKRTPSRTPEGLSEAVPQASTTQHFGLSIPRHWILSAPRHWPQASGEPLSSSTGPCHCHGYPQQMAPRLAQPKLAPAESPGSPVNSGSSQVGVRDTTTQPGVAQCTTGWADYK